MTRPMFTTNTQHDSWKQPRTVNRPQPKHHFATRWCLIILSKEPAFPESARLRTEMRIARWVWAAAERDPQRSKAN